MFRFSSLSLAIVAALSLCARRALAEEPAAEAPHLRITERRETQSQPPLYQAYLTQPGGLELIGPSGLSEDMGRTWKPFRPTPDFSAGLPYGYRREDSFPSVVDPHSGRLVKVYNALDTPELDPAIFEPPIALQTYYVRYRVSTDDGRSYLFDEPVVEQGHTVKNPFQGVTIGRNGIFFGDIGSVPIFNRCGELLAPLQPCLADEEGELANPGGGTTYHDVLIAVGTWTDDHHMKWQSSERIKGDPKKTTRGLCEPTLAETPDGRILMVMRGSNGGRLDRKFKIPSYKWMSISEDGGHTWSKAIPWTYDTGAPFYSPSSMSRLITHSSGRVFWIGNICPENARGNAPRWPLVMGEVDPNSLRLVESSLITVDTRTPDDPKQLPNSIDGRLDISHFWAIEDRETGDIVLTYPRALNKYQVQSWIQCRIGIETIE